MQFLPKIWHDKEQLQVIHASRPPSEINLSYSRSKFDQKEPEIVNLDAWWSHFAE